MIELRDVALSFADRPLFQEVNLELRPGEIVLIRGKSGSGKTSLLRLLSGFHPPDRGTLTLDRRPYSEFRYENLRSRIVYLHQSPVMEETLSVLENLMVPFGFRIHKSKKKPEREELLRLCAALHLAPGVLEQKAGSLSGGERQRAAFIRAHLLQPDFMLLDEPLANLDEESATAIGAWLSQKTLDSTGLVIASHQPVGNPPEQKLRVLEMAEGRLRECGD